MKVYLNDGSVREVSPGSFAHYQDGRGGSRVTFHDLTGAKVDTPTANIIRVVREPQDR